MSKNFKYHIKQKDILDQNVEYNNYIYSFAANLFMDYFNLNLNITLLKNNEYRINRKNHYSNNFVRIIEYY
jgi:hypothetical protein